MKRMSVKSHGHGVICLRFVACIALVVGWLES